MQTPTKHACEMCFLPVRTYGRLSPCKHVFCMPCAEKLNGSCTRCYENIASIKSLEFGQIFICSFGGNNEKGISGCGISYLTQRDLNAHVKHKHEKKRYKNLATEQSSNSSFDNMTAQPLMSISIGSQYSGSTSGVIKPLMDLTETSALLKTNMLGSDFVEQVKSPIKSPVIDKVAGSIQPLMSIPIASEYKEVRNSTTTPIMTSPTEPISVDINKTVTQQSTTSESRSPVIDRGLRTLMSIPIASQYNEVKNLQQFNIPFQHMQQPRPPYLLPSPVKNPQQFNIPFQHMQQPRPLNLLPSPVNYNPRRQRQYGSNSSYQGNAQNNTPSSLLPDLPPPWGRLRR